MGKDVGKLPWMVIGGIVAATALFLNAKNGNWKYTIFLVIGIAMMGYGFISKK